MISTKNDTLMHDSLTMQNRGESDKLCTSMMVAFGQHGLVSVVKKAHVESFQTSV